jgi:hypothetical protein
MDIMIQRIRILARFRPVHPLIRRIIRDIVYVLLLRKTGSLLPHRVGEFWAHHEVYVMVFGLLWIACRSEFDISVTSIVTKEVVNVLGCLLVASLFLGHGLAADLRE